MNTATAVTTIRGHIHIRAGACSGCRAAIGYGDDCAVGTITSGYRPRYHYYHPACAVRLGIVPNATHCDR